MKIYCVVHPTVDASHYCKTEQMSYCTDCTNKHTEHQNISIKILEGIVHTRYLTVIEILNKSIANIGKLKQNMCELFDRILFSTCLSIDRCTRNKIELLANIDQDVEKIPLIKQVNETISNSMQKIKKMLGYDEEYASLENTVKQILESKEMELWKCKTQINTLQKEINEYKENRKLEIEANQKIKAEASKKQEEPTLDKSTLQSMIIEKQIAFENRKHKSVDKKHRSCYYDAYCNRKTGDFLATSKCESRLTFDHIYLTCLICHKLCKPKKHETCHYRCYLVLCSEHYSAYKYLYNECQVCT